MSEEPMTDGAMMNRYPGVTDVEPETIFFARPAPDIAILRVEGRGTHTNSPALQSVAGRLLAENPKTRFIIDLKECPTMDSTFLGSLASIALRQLKAGPEKTVVIHSCEQTRRLLVTLGLGHVLDMWETAPPVGTAQEEFEAAEAPELSKLERVIHMIQAHERLVQLDGGNEVRFEGVLQYLRDSLQRERDKQKGG